jgi:hypothetical protein
MPFTYAIDRTKGVIRTRCAGFVTLPEVLEHFDALVREPDPPRPLDVLLDLRSTTSLPTAEKLTAVGDKIMDTRGRIEFGVCAIVVGSDVLHATAMMFEVVAARAFRTSRIFRDLYEAASWLETEHQTKK